jgi:hypothetical protein
MKVLVAILALMLVSATPAAADDGPRTGSIAYPGGPRYIGQSADLTVRSGTPATFVACWDSATTGTLFQCATVTVIHTIPQRYLVTINGPEGTVAIAVLDVTP